MYLYFNKEGILTTSIPHGEIPRQGSDLNIFVCLEKDFFENKEEKKRSTINVTLILPNDEIGSTKMVTVDETQLLPFQKITSGEEIGDFIDGGFYETYHFKFKAEESTTIAGKVTATICIKKYDSSSGDLSDTEVELTDVVLTDTSYFGAVEIIIEKTYGGAKFNSNISTAHYTNLLNQINAINVRLNNILIGNSFVEANPTLTGNEEVLESIKITEKKYRIEKTIALDELEIGAILTWEDI